MSYTSATIRPASTRHIFLQGQWQKITPTKQQKVEVEISDSLPIKYVRFAVVPILVNHLLRWLLNLKQPILTSAESLEAKRECIPPN